MQYQTTTKISSKNQVVVPSWVRKEFKLKPNMEIVWLQIKPDEICILPKKPISSDVWANKMCGILREKGNKKNIVDDFLKEKQKEIERENNKTTT